MRYAVARSTASDQARSRRIGRCARCHAPVLADEENYGQGDDLVHGACGAQPAEAGPRAPGAASASRPPVALVPPGRRLAALAGQAPGPAGAQPRCAS